MRLLLTHPGRLKTRHHEASSSELWKAPSPSLLGQFYSISNKKDSVNPAGMGVVVRCGFYPQSILLWIKMEGV